MFNIRNITLLLMLLLVSNSYSETYTCLQKENLYLEVNKCTFLIYKRFKSWIDPDEKRRKYNDSISHCASIDNYILSEGKIRIRKNKIICYDPELKRYYTFIKINDSTLLCTKHTALFVKGNLLMLSW